MGRRPSVGQAARSGDRAATKAELSNLAAVFSLVPELPFGNAVRETPVSRPAPDRIQPPRNRSFAEHAPEQEFGSEGAGLEV
jgi:hypothetical protein